MNEIHQFYSNNIKCWIENPRDSIRNGYLCMLGDVSGKHIIDVGCGCGHDILALNRKYNDVTGVGLDFCQNSIAEAQKMIGDCEGWELVNEDMMTYTSERKFDIVLFSMVVMHYADLSPIFAKLASLLVPGGRLLLVTNNPYLICKEYNILYPEGSNSIPYQHHFPYRDNDLSITKYVHSISNYINTAFAHGFSVSEINEQAVYNQETQFFNPTPNNSIPNFLSILYKLSN